LDERVVPVRKHNRPCRDQRVARVKDRGGAFIPALLPPTPQKNQARVSVVQTFFPVRRLHCESDTREPEIQKPYADDGMTTHEGPTLGARLITQQTDPMSCCMDANMVISSRPSRARKYRSRRGRHHQQDSLQWVIPRIQVADKG
jgi:hypothetical protein